MTYTGAGANIADIWNPYKVDMNWYGCSCGCDELFRMHEMYQCPDCLSYIAIEHSECHKCLEQ